MRRLLLPSLAAAVLAIASPGRAGIPPAAPSSPGPLVPAPSPAALPAPVPVDPAKAAQIRLLFELLNIEAQMKETMAQKIAALRKSSPQLSAEFWDALQGRLDIAELLTLLVPVYDKYYTKDELDGLIAFYQSPLGRKVIVAMPQIGHDVKDVGHAWAEGKIQQAIQQLKQQQPPKPEGQ